MLNSATTISGQKTCFDNCLLHNTIKKLFKSKQEKIIEPEFKISNTISNLKLELQSISNTSPIEMSFEYLLSAEKNIPDTQFRYVVVYKNDSPVLFVYFQLFTITSANFNFRDDKHFMKSLLNFLLKLKTFKVLISGNAFRNETLCYSYDNNLINKEDVTKLVASVAEKIADDENAMASILKDLPFLERPKKWLSDIGYINPMSDLVMNMAIAPHWLTLNDYVANLTRKYRTRAKKILMLKDSLQIKELDEQEIKAHQKKIDELFKNVIRKQPFVMTCPEKEHFTELKKIYQNDFEIVGVFLNNEMVAFYAAFISKNDYEIYYVGFDYDVNTTHQLYFNLLFSGLERAITLKKKQLKLGRTSFDAKASLGAIPFELTYFIKGNNIPRVAGKWFVNYFSTMEDVKWKLRNPLTQ